MSEEPETPATPPPDAEPTRPPGEDEEQPEGEEQEHPAEEAVPTAAVEPSLGFTEFVSVAPALRGLSPALREAQHAALKRYMRRQRLAPEGHYPLSAWQEFYTRMLAHQ
jgi:hypothetical protein